MADSNKNIGPFVTRRFRPGFVVLSYIISYIGSWATLELMNRRTGLRGIYNWLVLVAASICMGGIGTWSMHYIGNLAIILENAENQINYSLGMTILSFFLPVLMEFIALGIIGSYERLSTSRAIMSSLLTSYGLICMHYMAQASISNYQCTYNILWVVGAMILSFLACMAGITGFFMIYVSWKTSWWKRALCAVIISLAVSAVHWLSSIGTYYHAKIAKPNSGLIYSGSGEIIVITLISMLGLLILTGFGIISQRRNKIYARTVQKLVLAVVVFDQEGKFLVTPDGHLPLQKITDTWLEQSLDDEFNISHPVFLWMYRTARNWDSIVDFIPDMRTHIYQTNFRRHRFSKAESLVSDEGIPIKEYSLVIKELFCIASADLASDLSQPLEAMGILYDEIIDTGQFPKEEKQNGSHGPKISGSLEDLENDISVQRVSGKGRILFLVNIIEEFDAQHLKAVGYRFANIASIAPLLASSLQIRHKTLIYHIKMMQNYIKSRFLLEQGIYFAVFAMRASLFISHMGFDILARKDAKTQLPSMQIDINDFNNWHFEYLKKMEDMSMIGCIEYLSHKAGSNKSSEVEQNLAKTFLISLEALRNQLNNPVYDNSQLLAMPLEVPSWGGKKGSRFGKASIIVFKIFVPIYEKTPVDKLLFVPLNFFMMAQHAFENDNYHEMHANKVQNDFNSIKDVSRGSFQEQNVPQFFHKSEDDPQHKYNFTTYGKSIDTIFNRSRSRNLSNKCYGGLKDKTWGTANNEEVTGLQVNVSGCSGSRSSEKFIQFAKIKHGEQLAQLTTNYMDNSTQKRAQTEDSYIDKLVHLTITERLWSNLIN